MGNQASLAAGIGAGSDTHRVGVDAFAAHTMPHHHPNFTTVGANVNAQAGRVGAHAGIAHTPMFRQTEHSVGAGLNLHKSPTSSVDVNIGSSRMVTPHHRGDWNHGINFGVKKHF
ncbi:hypothetical protein O0L34_g18463 [Tuta absoluta]|nr:hypothetical protein O0L34_g18463 [Tuta absoluta]